jgi:hypothetical protein
MSARVVEKFIRNIGNVIIKEHDLPTSIGFILGRDN